MFVNCALTQLLILIYMEIVTYIIRWSPIVGTVKFINMYPDTNITSGYMNVEQNYQ